MNKILIATANKHKLAEFRKILPQDIEIKSLADFPELDEIEETGTTYAENALIKARVLSRHTGLVTIADDSGLSVDALMGRPGIYSARYAGTTANDQSNRKKLLHEMHGVKDTSAAFICVIAIAGKHLEKTFEGKLTGNIILEERGEHGFGYDPVFIPHGYSSTLAEMDPAEKNRISHRYLAIQQLLDYLKRTPVK